MDSVLHLIWSAVFLLMFAALVFGFVHLVYLGLGPVFGGPYVDTPARQREAMLRLAAPKEGETWVDMGSGDGKVLVDAARAGAEAVGYELSPALLAISWLRGRHAGLSGRITHRMLSYWRADLSQADIISVYLISYRMRKLRDKLASGLKPGCRIVSVDFTLPDWTHEAEDNSVFLYVVPGGGPS